MELCNFDKYALWFDGPQAGQSQSKAEKDLLEMRFKQVFTQSITQMYRSSNGGRILVFLSVDKAEKIGSLSKLLQLKH